MFIERYINIDQQLKAGQALVILGPRRSGKTTLLNKFLKTTAKKAVFYRGDELSVQNSFSEPRSDILALLIGTNDVLVIDEAQMIPNIGKSLKLIVDTNPNLSVVVSGSSAFELAGQIGEPLTGRKQTLFLYPVATNEFYSNSNTPEQDLSTNLNNLLIYGMYPSVLTTNLKNQKFDFLKELVDSYLLKDILTFKEVKASSILLKLLNLLAFQIGSEVSLTELGASLGLDKKTVERYIGLLEKAYIIFRVGGYSKNLRTEVTKMSKYYFYDNGIRNMMINNFNSLDIRNDIDQLWENFVFSERLKTRTYYGPRANQYFWRTYSGSEIDLLEERNGLLYAYEIKWSSRSSTKQKKLKAPKEWLEAYPKESQWSIIDPVNFYNFVKNNERKV